MLYCSRDDLPNSQWKSQLTDSVVEHITISELIPNKCYYFKVQALYHKTAGQESLVSDAISTEHVVFGPPGECITEDVTHSSVTLCWSKPPNINPSKVECYKVLYRSEYDPPGDWKSKITEDEKTSMAYLRKQNIFSKYKLDPQIITLVRKVMSSLQNLLYLALQENPK